MTNMKRKQKQWCLVLVAFGVFGALPLGGCAPEKKSRTKEQEEQAQTLVNNGKNYLNPTNTTATELEGAWLAPCRSESVTVNGATARSYTKGYIFKGNSFYRQIDYYSTTDCSRDTSHSLADTRAAVKYAAGWFSLQSAGNGLKNINMLSAPNFGGEYEANVFVIAGTGEFRTLTMGDSNMNSSRPSSATITYDHWDLNSLNGS
jgi:hypothetical protein